MFRPSILVVCALALAACGDTAEIKPEPATTDIPEELKQADAAPPSEVEQIGTPMADRVATLGILNKRNNLSQDLEMKPGEAKRVGDVIIRLSACERTPPWELPRQTGAFVQVLVENREEEGSWLRIFSGWLIKETPSINVVEHPIYDVWVKDCAMSFPGGDDPAPSAPATAPSAGPAATPSAAPVPAPAPAPAPETNET